MSARKLKIGDPVLTPNDGIGFIRHPEYGTAETPAKDMYVVAYVVEPFVGGALSLRQSNFWERELTLLVPEPDYPSLKDVAAPFREYVSGTYLSIASDEKRRNARLNRIKSYLAAHGVTSATDLKPEKRAAAIAYVRGLMAEDQQCCENWNETENFGGDPKLKLREALEPYLPVDMSEEEKTTLISVVQSRIEKAIEDDKTSLKSLSYTEFEDRLFGALNRDYDENVNITVKHTFPSWGLIDAEGAAYAEEQVRRLGAALSAAGNPSPESHFTRSFLGSQEARWEDPEGDAHSTETPDEHHVDDRKAQGRRVGVKDLKNKRRISVSFTPDGEGALDPGRPESSYNDMILQSILEAFRTPAEPPEGHPDHMSNADLQAAIDNTYLKLRPGPFDGRSPAGGEYKKVLEDHLAALLFVQRQRLGLKT